MDKELELKKELEDNEFYKNKILYIDKKVSKLNSEIDLNDLLLESMTNNLANLNMELTELMDNYENIFNKKKEDYNFINRNNNRWHAVSEIVSSILIANISFFSFAGIKFLLGTTFTMLELFLTVLAGTCSYYYFSNKRKTDYEKAQDKYAFEKSCLCVEEKETEIRECTEKKEKINNTIKTNKDEIEKLMNERDNCISLMTNTDDIINTEDSLDNLKSKPKEFTKRL